MGNMKRNLIIALVSFLILCFAAVTFGQIELFEKWGVNTIEGPKWMPDEIIVKFKRGVSQDVIRQINQRHGTSVLSISKRGQFKRLRIPKNRTVEEMVAIYSRNPNVEYAEPNYIAHAFWVPNDKYYHYQWHLDNAEYGGINMESAWDIEIGYSSVIVAVIDTGVAYEDYEEFVDNPGRGRDYWITYQLAPDLAGTNFVAGYDFVNDDLHPNDDEGHGTHVTGTIAQSTNNTIGVAGVAFNTSIMPVKVLDSSGSGTYADVADGIYFAADDGAKIINMSLGGGSGSTTLENAVAYAYGKGVTIVCASGNNGSATTVSYPAAYDAYCIAVGATRYDEAVAYYSNGGPSLDLTAPGGDIKVDQNDDGYADGVLQQTFGDNPTDWGYWFYQGTSMAAPHVSGVAALLIAKAVATTPDEVREALQSTAEDKGAAGWDAEYGWGIVDAYAALIYSPEPIHDVAVTDISAPSWCVQGDSVDVVVSMANQGDYDESFTVTLTDATDSVEIGSQTVTLPAKGTADLNFTWDTTGASIGDHTLKAEASAVGDETDTADNSMTTTVTINEKTAYTMHVASIDMVLSTRTAGRNKFTKALATVTIVDANDIQVEGATVYGYWSGATSDTDYGVTDSAGKVTLVSDEVKNPPSGTTFTFTVDDVVKSGWTYDSASNIETSDSVIVK